MKKIIDQYNTTEGSKTSFRPYIEQLNHNDGSGSRGVSAGQYYERYEHHEHHHYVNSGFQVAIDTIDLYGLLIYPAEFVKLLNDVSGVVGRISNTEGPKTAWSLLGGLVVLNALIPRVNATATTLMEQRTPRFLVQSSRNGIHHEGTSE